MSWPMNTQPRQPGGEFFCAKRRLPEETSDDFFSIEAMSPIVGFFVQFLLQRASSSFFDLHVLQKVPVRKTARTLRASAASVYMAKYRAGRLWKEEILRLKVTGGAEPGAISEPSENCPVTQPIWAA